MTGQHQLPFSGTPSLWQHCEIGDRRFQSNSELHCLKYFVAFKLHQSIFQGTTNIKKKKFNQLFQFFFPETKMHTLKYYEPNRKFLLLFRLSNETASDLKERGERKNFILGPFVPESHVI